MNILNCNISKFLQILGILNYVLKLNSDQRQSRLKKYVPF